MGLKIKLNNVRLGFAQQLFNPSAVEEGQTKKFGCDSLLVPGHSVLKAVVKDEKTTWVPTTMPEVLLAVANETIKGTGKAKPWLDALEGSKRCYRNGDTRVTKGGDAYEGYEGVWYVAAKSKTRPLLIDANKQPLTEADGKPYSGCYANVVIEVYGMGDPKKKGVHAAIKSVQFVKDGDAFGGGAPSSPDDFDDLGTGADAGDLA
jgi:hypothetical protein